MKIGENKNASISFLLFLFIFWNRDFSKGYGRFKQLFFSPDPSPPKTSPIARFVVSAIRKHSAIF